MERTLLSRAGVGVAARIQQQQELTLLRVAIDQPILILVKNGSKTLRWNHHECVVRAGEAIAIAGGHILDIINQPSEHGAYEAAWLVWDAALITEHATRAETQRGMREPLAIRSVAPAFLQAFHSALDCIIEPERIPLPIARHRLAEMLVWLDLHGVRFAHAALESVSGRVRQMLSAAPDQGWTAPQVAKQLAMSETTLRRRLAAEEVSLSELLVDVRMSYALTLLQATDRPISQIALDSGYESASRFAVRFRKRFGFAPTAIRGHSRDA